MSKNHLSRKLPKHRCKKLSPNCEQCQALKDNWYSKLKESGFDDIELDSGYLKTTVNVYDKTMDIKVHHYERAWLVYHDWFKADRVFRDLRIAELYASQYRKTGTLDGMVLVLKEEGFRGYSKRLIHETVKLIKADISKK